MRVGYIRVSTITQNTERQLDGVLVEKVFVDHASGKSMERPKLQECLSFVREGDVLVVHSMDRLARNLIDLRQMVENLNSKGVAVEFVKADAGLDIGNTLIGMHLKHVAVPLRLSVKHIGEAAVNAARTRPKLIGGVRAEYPEEIR